MAKKDIAVRVDVAPFFNKEELVMILSYFEESLLRCYKHKGLRVTNVHQQPAGDFDDKIPLNSIVCAKSIVGKCIEVLSTMYAEEQKEGKNDVSKVPQEGEEGKSEQDKEG